ncbi:MAG TPA: heme exporter protein CcmB [Acidimicrobiales bacterium]|nr:heme exporter protein CcmB [Acidimicrobiales bacterium]
MSPPMWRDAVLVAGKDLRIEARSRVATNQVAPFAIVILVLFGFALDPDRGVLGRASAGLFWVAVLLSALLAVQRSFAVEAGDGVADGLRLSGLDPAGVFLGKAAAVAAQLALLQVVLAVGIVVLYDADLGGPALLLATSAAATVGLAAAGTVYGVLAAGLEVRETLLPLLLLPVVAPVLLSATRAWEAGMGISVDDGWRWAQLLAVFAVVYVTLGILAFGALLEES